MRRFFTIWFACWTMNLLVWLAVSLGWFRHADLRFETFAANQVAPAVQALILAWWIAPPSPTRAAERLRRALRDPLAPVVIVLEVALVLAGLAWPDHQVFGLATGSPVPRAWLGTTLLAAGLAFGLVARAARSGWVAGASVLLAGLGVQAFWPWTNAVIAFAVPSLPTVIRWLAVDVPALGFGLLIVLNAADRLDDEPRAWVHLALAAFMLVALISGMALFLRPYYVEPWGAIVRTAASISSSCLLVGALRAVQSIPRPRVADATTGAAQ